MLEESSNQPTMASQEDPAANKMKRTSFSPWSSGIMGSRPGTMPKSHAQGPEPPRIVSDILEGAAVKTSAVGGLANNAKIQALQRQWEQNNVQAQEQSIQRPPSTGPSRPSSTGPPAVPSLRPPPRKRDSPASDTPAVKKQALGDRRPSPSSASDGGAQMVDNQTRANARRFTEAEVARQMSELTGASVKKSAMPPAPALTATAGPPRAPARHFPTGGELLKKVMDAQAASSPSPVPRAETLTQPSPVPAPTPGDRIVAIAMAEQNRAYVNYLAPDGTMVSGRGALIPSNYKLYDSNEYPFVCPVRDCRRLFAGLKGLGGHFGASHCSTTFNDNGDGTLTKVSNYVKHGGGGSPGIVISKHPLPSNAPPPSEAGLPYVSAAQKRASGIGLPEAPERKPSTRLSDAAPKPVLPVLTWDVKEYLHQFLSPAQKHHSREDVTAMLSLPRRRSLPDTWIQNHRGGDVDINHYACALAYLTGKEVTGPEECVANTRSSSRPSARLSHPCIALWPGLSASAKQAFFGAETCVGCRYWCHLQRQRNCCDWGPESRSGRGSSGSASGSEEATTRSDAMEVDQDYQPEKVSQSRVMTETAPEPRQTKRVQSQAAPTGLTMREQPMAGVVGGPGQMGGVDLEMEDWEVAPGRVRDESSENIAFSNSYLTSGQPITVSEDISFNVLVIKPGSASHWSVEDDKLRTCSVAAGKVRVTMGEKMFQLGPNGMFVVRPGQACKVENRLYVDSIIHCTTIDNFSLQ
ncbi:hypothetical protein CDV36_011274 [Fusarium kuroshium]|uniref:C2H2-type domain-containing protein n=1 Tax=Fusarium kuroshium TaxID=2010991 RepID=A0A3M2RUZ6_9HYPO|nr:hypothetical protein CDV36_011274 [Fusarium kuroshium]